MNGQLTGLTEFERAVFMRLGDATRPLSIAELAQDLDLVPAAVRSAIQILRRLEFVRQLQRGVELTEYGTRQHRAATRTHTS